MNSFPLVKQMRNPLDDTNLGGHSPMLLSKSSLIVPGGRLALPLSQCRPWPQGKADNAEDEPLYFRQSTARPFLI
jgi:hypothetical protein